MSTADAKTDDKAAADKAAADKAAADKAAADKAAASSGELTAAKVARLVTIEEPVLDDDGKPTGKTRTRTLREKDVLAFKDHGTHINVVTVAGRKHRIEK